MSDNQLKNFKRQGNDCFKKDKFAEAIESWSQALEVERANNSKNVDEEVNLLSNIAQAYLQLKDYSKAIELADKALNLDPEHLKSLLRRGNAHLDTKDNGKAATDFRHFLKLEPTNEIVIEKIRRIYSSRNMSSKFRHSVFGHTLRCYLKKHVKSSEVVEKAKHWIQYKRLVSRLAFLSKAAAESMRFYINGMSVLPENKILEAGYVGITFSMWHVTKHLFCEPSRTYLFTFFEIQLIQALLKVTKPDDVRLCLEFDCPLPDWLLNMCTYRLFSFVTPEDFANQAGKPEAVILKKCRNFVTELPYFNKFSQFLNNVQFPKAQTVFFGNKIGTVDVKFLKRWRKSKWDIKRVNFMPFPENVDGFKKIGEISESVTDVQISFMHESELVVLKKIYTHMDVLKNAFPSLINVTSGVDCNFELNGAERFITKSFSDYVSVVSAAANESARPPWCQSFRFCSTFYIHQEMPTEGIQNFLFDELKKQVKCCRESMLSLMHIQDPVSGYADFNYYSNRCCFAVINASDENVEYQFAFQFYE